MPADAGNTYKYGLPIYHVDRVRYYKEDEKGVETMCKSMEEMRNEASRAKAIQIARRMLDSGKLTYEEIAEFSDLTIEEVKTLDEKQPA